MKRTKYYWLCLLICYSTSVASQLRVPKLISDGMVLQRDIKLNIWGWATASENVTILFNHQQYRGKADEKGNWIISLPPQKAGGPFTMTINSGNEITIKDILIGDVWICSGQSNMELMMSRVKYKYPDEIKNASNPAIRQFTVPDKYDFNKEAQDLDAGQWLPVNEKNILEFSAVAYFFAKELNAKYKIPIGLINAALGGSPAQSWINEEGLKKFPAYYDELQLFKNNNLITETERKDRAAANEWYQQLNAKDEGQHNNWKDAQLDDGSWDQIKVPGYWSQDKNINGVVWYRKTFGVPAHMTGKDALLWLGRIVDADSVFVNGQFVGNTTYQYPPRIYNIPSPVLKEGTNNIVVRIVNNYGKGGFVTDKKYAIMAGNDSIDLKGDWKYKIGAVMPPAPSSTTIRWKPGGLYNAMIAPLVKYGIKGAIWYQGEANAGHPDDYFDLMHTLIQQWRKNWKQGDFPFAYVQLPNFGEPRNNPAESNWARLREQQLRLQSIHNTAMVVAIDIGEWNDIHPLNKKDVGHRLALAAVNIAHGEKNIAYAGPVYQSAKVKENTISLSFANTGNSLQIKGDINNRQFAIAGADKQFVWASAKVTGNKVIVWNNELQHPLYVRYAWADNPGSPCLYNQQGFPASPFRTDSISTHDK